MTVAEMKIRINMIVADSFAIKHLCLDYLFKIKQTMAFQEAAQSFVELLRKLCDSSLHISCVANTLYAHEEPRRPSLNDATKACEELKMDVLENHFRLMKVEYKERQSQLTAKMNKGLSLTADEEEWIDGKGNLIDGELLIGRLSALASASGNESIHLNSDNVKTFSEIHDFHPKKSTKLPDRKKIAAKKNDKPEKTNTEKQKVLTSGKDSSTKKSAIQSNKDSSVKESVIPPTNVIPKDSGEIQTVIAAKVNSSDKQSSVQKSKRKSADLAHSSSQISNASYAEKVQVLDWHHKNGKNQTKTSAHFQKIFPLLKIKQPLLSKWLKAEDTIRAKHQESSHDATKRIRTLTYPKVEAALSEWMTQACFKSYYRKKAILRSINLFTEEMDKEEKTPMKNMFKVDQLLAMRMSQKAWDSVSALTIANCWGVTKIIKQSPNSCLEVINKSIENSTAALESQLNTLEFIGAVLPRNRMSISNLLDPEGENNHALQMRSDEEIFASVHNEDGEEDLVDCNPNSKEPEIPRPSKKDMCSIISRALRYLEDMDDSDSNKLTDLLETYQQKVLNDLHFKGQQAGIRDYFNPVTPQTTSTSRIEPSQKPPVASTSKVTLEMFV
ncbi:hypothetical protein KEM48_003465 [Puccinia striiformis f. sp. tritici PST-130]|nr:hypothetical protein KEM48_003465 [Puccinia striiformis f. sp. tritici PST-130]